MASPSSRETTGAARGPRQSRREEAALYCAYRFRSSHTTRTLLLLYSCHSFPSPSQAPSSSWCCSERWYRGVPEMLLVGVEELAVVVLRRPPGSTVTQPPSCPASTVEAPLSSSCRNPFFNLEALGATVREAEGAPGLHGRPTSTVATSPHRLDHRPASTDTRPSSSKPPFPPPVTAPFPISTRWVPRWRRRKRAQAPRPPGFHHRCPSSTAA